MNRPRAMRCGDMRPDLRVLPGGDRFSPGDIVTDYSARAARKILVRLTVKARILESTVRVLASACRRASCRSRVVQSKTSGR